MRDLGRGCDLCGNSLAGQFGSSRIECRLNPINDHLPFDGDHRNIRISHGVRPALSPVQKTNKNPTICSFDSKHLSTLD